jgi:hypothetical protein
MAEKPLINPFAMNDAVLEIGLGHSATTFDDYTEAVSQAEFIPTTSTGTWTGIGGNTLSNTSSATWGVTAALAQDNSPEGLSDFLFDHEGEEATVRLTPKAGGRGWEGDVTLTPTAIGGTAGNTPAVGTATFPLQGRPRKVPAPPEG